MASRTEPSLRNMGLEKMMRTHSAAKKQGSTLTTIRMTSEDQLPEFLCARFRVTIRKYFLTLAYLYAFGTGTVNLTAGGAEYQRNSGSRTNIKGPGGESLMRGTEAAHFAFASFYTPRGQTTDVFEGEMKTLMAGVHDKGRRDRSIAAIALPSCDLLCSLLVANEASTYLAPAMINQADGKVEAALHDELSAVLPSHIPGEPGNLQSLMGSGARSIFQKAFDPEDLRVRILNGSAGVPKIQQDPNDPDPLCRLFGGDSAAYYFELLYQVRNANSKFNGLMRRYLARVQDLAREAIALAVDARDEREMFLAMQ